jgi:hypothetical protein
MSQKWGFASQTTPSYRCNVFSYSHIQGDPFGT